MNSQHPPKILASEEKATTTTTTTHQPTITVVKELTSKDHVTSKNSLGAQTRLQ